MESDGALHRPILARVSEMPANYLVEAHQHLWGQLVYSSRGIMKVEVPGANFIIPPERAIWVPCSTLHTVSTKFGLSFRSLYVDNLYSTRLPQVPTAINVNKLLRELILNITLWPDDYVLTQKKSRHIQFLLDQIEDAIQVPLSLTMPTDRRVLKITDFICEMPSDNTTLQQWSKSVGATPRTINRIFQKETQMGFIEWRQRLRLLYSFERIEKGDKISSLALDLGYDSSSAFITMFKKHMKVSPKQYFKSTSRQGVDRLTSTPEKSL
ncbi:MAG: helix-turn-helix transcriptional regulator [Kangiellaceae bacterium]|nr:helix-turn-helix transcriptional regulator [Kangiellaceae bacterium]